MDEQQINPTHSFAIADVTKYGSIEKAIIMKEIASMQVYKQRTSKNDWVHYSGEALAAKFPYMKSRSIRRWMEELVSGGHLESAVKNKKKYDQTKSYRLPELSTVGQNDSSIGQFGQSKNGQFGQPIPPHSPPLSTSHSKGLSFEQKKAYAIACEQDRALARREVGRAASSNRGSFGSVSEIMAARQL